MNQNIAHYLPDSEEWHVGFISSLNYRKQLWATYPKLPKHQGKMVEYSHAFRESDYGKLWYFVEISAEVMAEWHA